MPKSTKSQKELYFQKLEEQRRQQEEAAAAAAASSEPERTTGSVRSNNDTDSKSGIFVNQGVYHPSLGVIALTNGTDAGYIARKAMKFNSANGELSEGQQALAAKQAVSQAYTGLVQSIALDMLKNLEPLVHVVVTVTIRTEPLAYLLTRECSTQPWASSP